MNKILHLIEALLRLVIGGVLLVLGALSVYALFDRASVEKSATVFAGNAIDTMRAEEDKTLAWIVVEGTHLNQPVAKGEDNDFYLRHNYKGEYAAAGSAFLDYRNSDDYDDDFSVIYGHRMSGDLMFADVKLFAGQEFFDEHEQAWLRAGGEKHNLKVLAYAVIGSRSELYNLRKYANGKNEEIWEILAADVRHRREGKGGRLVMLSTCDVAEKDKRDVLLLEWQ